MKEKKMGQVAAWSQGFDQGWDSALEQAINAAKQWIIHAEQGSGKDLIDALEKLRI